MNKFDFDGNPDDLAIEPPRDPKEVVGDKPQDDLPVPLEPPKSVRNPRVQFDDEDFRQFEKQFDLKRSDSDEAKAPAQKKGRLDDREKLSLKRSYSKTPGCPSCDTGMVAPGIRHSAKCRRINQPVAVPETPQRSSDIEIEEPDANVAVGVENSECEYSPTTAPPSPQGDMEIEIPQENEFVERSKRRHDDEADDVERELKRERLDELLDDNALGLFWEETTDPVFTISQIVHMPTLPATGPNMLVENLTSIRYDSSLDHVKQEVTWGLGKVLVWRPTEAIDDSTLAQVNVEQCFAGMCDEVNNMEACVF